MCKFNVCLRKLPRTNTCILLFSFSSKKYVGRQIKIKAVFKRSSMNSNALFGCVSFSKHSTYTTIFWFKEYQNTYKWRISNREKLFYIGCIVLYSFDICQRFRARINKDRICIIQACRNEAVIIHEYIANIASSCVLLITNLHVKAISPVIFIITVRLSLHHSRCSRHVKYVLRLFPTGVQMYRIFKIICITKLWKKIQCKNMKSTDQVAK